MHNEQERLANGLFGDCEEKSGRGEEGKREREREARREGGRDRMCEGGGGGGGIGGGWVGRVSWSIS